jgi:hypothetical protein
VPAGNSKEDKRARRQQAEAEIDALGIRGWSICRKPVHDHLVDRFVPPPKDVELTRALAAHAAKRTVFSDAGNLHMAIALCKVLLWTEACPARHGEHTVMDLARLILSDGGQRSSPTGDGVERQREYVEWLNARLLREGDCGPRPRLDLGPRLPGKTGVDSVPDDAVDGKVGAGTGDDHRGPASASRATTAAAAAAVAAATTTTATTTTTTSLVPAP